MRVAIVVSAHGFGHLARQLAVGEALASSGARPVYFTAVPEPVVRADTRDAQVVPWMVDVGIVQRDSLTEDVPATVERLGARCADDRIDALAERLRGMDRVVVDVAPAALEDARENFRLNGIDPTAHGFECTDAFRYTQERPSDFVICDPPSLAHDKDADGAARKAYRDLHRHVGGLSTSLLAASSCTARLSFERWEETLREGLKAGWSVLHRSAEPPDHPVGLQHPEGRYLKFALLSRT